MVSGYYDIINKTLGRGHYGVVKLGRHCLTSELVAIKIIEKSRLNNDSLNQLGNEIKILFKLCEYEHPNILKLYQTIDTRGKLFLITEYCGPHACDLHDYLSKKQNSRHSGLKEIEAKIFFLQICSAISYCHSMGIVHRDLKPENILVTDYRHTQIFSSSTATRKKQSQSNLSPTPKMITPTRSSPIVSSSSTANLTTEKQSQQTQSTHSTLSDTHIITNHTCDKDDDNKHVRNQEPVMTFANYPLLKLIDFGFANKWSRGEYMRTSCGTLAYSAPELLLGEPYDGTKVDVWGLGLMLYILIYGGNPFMQINDNETLTKILDCSFATPPKSNVDNTNVVELLRSLIMRNPESRLTIEAILKHKWFDDIDKPVDPVKPFNYTPKIFNNNINNNNNTNSTMNNNDNDSSKDITSNGNIDNDRCKQSDNTSDRSPPCILGVNISEEQDEQNKLHDRVIQDMFKHPRFTNNRAGIELSLRASSLSHQNFDPRCAKSTDQCIIMKKKISSGLVRLLDPQRAREDSHSDDESGSSLDQDHSLSMTNIGDQTSVVESNRPSSGEPNSGDVNSSSYDDYVFATYQLTRDRIIRQASGLIEPSPSVASPVPEPIPEEGGYCVSNGGYFPYSGCTRRLGASGNGAGGDASSASSTSSDSSRSLRIGGANSATALAYSLPLARKCSLVNEESGCSSSSELCTTRDDDSILI